MSKKRIALKRQYRTNQSLQNSVLIAIGFFLVVGLIDLIEEKPSYIHPKIINFSAIQNFQLRKETFIDLLTPKIRAQNEKIAHQRKQIQKYIKEKNYSQLCEIAKKSNLTCSNLNLETELLERINQIPVPIVLAQAILESGWGTSRFSKQGLSLFGMWCFSKGCGIVPNDRDEDKNHEIKVYTTVSQSIEDYFQLINYGASFESFRLIRANQKEMNSKESVIALTQGLNNYSGIDSKEYIERVRKIILSGGLLKYN